MSDFLKHLALDEDVASVIWAANSASLTVRALRAVEAPKVSRCAQARTSIEAKLVKQDRLRSHQLREINKFATDRSLEMRVINTGGPVGRQCFGPGRSCHDQFLGVLLDRDARLVRIVASG